MPLERDRWRKTGNEPDSLVYGRVTTTGSVCEGPVTFFAVQYILEERRIGTGGKGKMAHLNLVSGQQQSIPRFVHSTLYKPLWCRKMHFDAMRLLLKIGI